MHGAAKTLAWSGALLGFALGGFFDGILLHQILQWHHLLSGVGQARHDIAVLILADGLFHLLMYLVAAAGLYLLWRGRRALAEGHDRQILGNAMIGFGTWHVVDAVLSHWVLGIHRIRMDVDNPLVWDLLWLAVFGLLPLGWGLLLRRRDHSGPTLAAAPLALALSVLVSGSVASLPAPGDGPVMVLFAPGTTPQVAMAATQELGARVVWTNPSEQLWAVEMDGGDPTRFYAHGAIVVSNSILPAGCFDWLRMDEPAQLAT